MKRIKTILLLVIAVIVMTTNTMAAQGVIRNGRTLVPVRGVFEELGFSVSWDSSVGKASLSDGKHEVSIIKGQNYIKVDGKQIYPDVPQQIINNGLYLPVKAIADAIGADTSWNAEKKLVHISYGGKDSYITCVEEKTVPKPVQTTTSKPAQTSNNNTTSKPKGATYILNTNTMKIHIPTCPSVGEIYPEHRQEYNGTLDDAIAHGYSPCGRCKPR